MFDEVLEFAIDEAAAPLAAPPSGTRTHTKFLGTPSHYNHISHSTLNISIFLS